MATLIRAIPEMQQIAEAARRGGKKIAVVPTMGALHEGHLSLIRIARQHADLVVTTIFVNPMQFGEGEDFQRYPRDLARDTGLASEAGADIIFTPDVSAMYPPGYLTSVTVEVMTGLLEGKSRPTHFRGVTTIVTKLFHCVKPHIAVFGQKDAQQVAVIRRMVSDLDFDIDMIVGPTVREPDGLAMSSRNVYLSPEQRRQAPVLYRSLRLAEAALRDGERGRAEIVRVMQALISSSSSGDIDYISIADAGSLQEVESVAAGQSVLVSLAVRFGTTRLIDNILVKV